MELFDLRVAAHRRGVCACEVSLACRWGSDAVFQSLREDRTVEERRAVGDAAAGAQDLPGAPATGFHTQGTSAAL